MDPFRRFQIWFKEARRAGGRLPESMTLATAGRDRRPSARMVLLKGVSKGGFVFFTNYDSRKACELAENPWAALVFYWPQIDKQVRIEGRVKKISRQESEAYFRTRPRESRIAAWTSPQSTALPDRKALEARFGAFSKKFAGASAIPCPPNWGGYRLIPMRFEFWESKPHRLHDRKAYARKGSRWTTALLAP